MALTPENLSAIQAITQEVADRKQEELAVMIGNNFHKLEQRFQSLEPQLRHLNEKLDENIQQTDDIKLALAGHSLLLHRIDRRNHDQQQRLDQHEIRLRRLEKHQGLRPLAETPRD